MACFEGKCFERPKNEIRRSGALQRKGSRVRVIPAGDLVIGVHPNAERPSEMENMNSLNESAIEKRGYNSAQMDCGCAKDYNLPEPFVDKVFPRLPPQPPVFTPEPPPKYEPKIIPPEEFFPIPEPDLKDNTPTPPEELIPIPPNVNKQPPQPPPPPACTGYEWLPTQEARDACCEELETVYQGDYEAQSLRSENCQNPSFNTPQTPPPPNTKTQIATPAIPPLASLPPAPNTKTQIAPPAIPPLASLPPNTIKVNSNSPVKIVESNVGSGFTTNLAPSNSSPSGFTVQTFQDNNVTPVSNPEVDGGQVTAEEQDNEYEQELIETGTSYSMDIPVDSNDSISHFTSVYTQPSFPPTDLVQSIPSLSQQGPAEASENTSSNNKAVAPSSGMNLGLNEINGMPQCNSIVRSVTVSRCGDENPYDRGMAIFDSYAGREAPPPGFVVDTDGSRIVKVKSSSGMRARIVPSGIPGASSSTSSNSGGPAPGEQAKQDNTGSTNRGPNAGAVTASVFNSLTNVAGDAFQYMNNQEANRVRLQIANLSQQRDLQLQAIQSGDLRVRAEAEARLASINQQGEALRQSLERERLATQASQQSADRDASFRTTAIIAGSVLVLGMLGAGVYVATRK